MPQSIAMSAIGVEVQFRRHLRILQSKEIDGGVFHMNRIVLGLHNERRRSLFGDANLRIRREVLFRQRQVAGIDHYRVIGPAADSICVVEGIVQALLKVRAECGGEVSAGGESQDSYTIGIDVPFAGMGANDPQGPLSVLQRGIWDRAQSRVLDI